MRMDHPTPSTRVAAVGRDAALEATATPLEVAMVGGTCLAREITLQWLRRVSPSCRVHQFAGAAELVGSDDAAGSNIIVLPDYLHSNTTQRMLDTICAIHEALPAIPIVVVTGSEDVRSIAGALHHGVRAYIPVRLPVQVAVAALRLVLLGGVFAPPVIGQGAPMAAGAEMPPGAPAREPATNEDEAPPLLDNVRLSPREWQVLRLLRTGNSNRQIGARLGISENTVMVHVRHLMRKLAATNRTQAVCRINELLKTSNAD
jgi:DNA-binding NarL/FixJ family response regulator